LFDLEFSVISHSVDQLLQAAPALTDEEPLQLVAALISAVDERGLRPFDDAWPVEIRRRSAEFDSGSVQPLSWAEVKEQARRSLPLD
jgi:putative addiction module component (TIGR02574 family)